MATGSEPPRRPAAAARRGPMLDQDPSMKARKAQLFEDEDLPASKAAPVGPRRSFAEIVRETPPAPLPAWLKAALGAAAVVVAALLVAGVMRLTQHRPTRAPARTAQIAPAAAAELPG